MSKIRKGDEIVVIAGKDKGRRGKVEQVLPTGKLIVEGVNVVKKHQRPNPNAGIAGGIVEQNQPIHISNVMLWNAKTGKGDRVGFKIDGERKQRIFKSTKEAVGS
jgi:large subunit ribosomal protein L24